MTDYAFHFILVCLTFSSTICQNISFIFSLLDGFPTNTDSVVFVQQEGMVYGFSRNMGILSDEDSCRIHMHRKLNGAIVLMVK